MSSFLSRGIQTTMSTKSVSFFSRKSRPGRVSSGIVEATMKSACHSIFLNQVPWLQAKTVQVQKHPSDVLAASHDIVLHDHRPQFWLMMPAQYVLDHGKNNESYSTGPNLVRSVCLKTRPKLQKHRGSQMLESQMGLGCLGVTVCLKTCPKLQKHRGSQMLESQMGLGCLGVTVCLKTCPKLQKHRGSQMLESQMGLGCLGVTVCLKTCPKLQKHRGSQMLESQMGLGCLGVTVCLKTCPKLQKHRGSQMLESQMGLGCLGVKAIIKTIWLGAKAVPSHQFSVFIAWNHLLSHDSHKGVEPRNSKQWTLANWPNQETIVPWSSMWSP